MAEVQARDEGTPRGQPSSQERDALTTDPPPRKDGVYPEAGAPAVGAARGGPGPPGCWPPSSAAVFGARLGSSPLTTGRAASSTQCGSAGQDRAPAKSKQTKSHAPGREVEGWPGANPNRKSLPCSRVSGSTVPRTRSSPGLCFPVSTAPLRADHVHAPQAFG